ncbi:uncharacterized protein LOC112196919 [Rosa chinensis]|uniref:uncharacterized protein LOC112196919 n=1 Tax=Rosa chinensis TaxID=74649 RepID=UPI000D0911B3|nr:uncharacterized protein LOC112196919 [Rosa chinensis]
MPNNIKASVDAHQSTPVDYVETFQIVAMLKMCMQLLGLVRHTESESKRNKLLGRDANQAPDSLSLDYSTQSKSILVRIVHAGGQEELFPNAIPASLLMDKYPGKCVARPEVFKKPQESLLRPDESLLPGQKYYIIPCTTAQKLKRQQQKKVKAKERAEDEEMILDGKITVDSEGEDTDDSICSASDFVSKEKRPKSSRRRGIRGRKPFVPPLPKVRSGRGFGWEPSLTSVQEVSP